MDQKKILLAAIPFIVILFFTFKLAFRQDTDSLDLSSQQIAASETLDLEANTKSKNYQLEDTKVELENNQVKGAMSNKELPKPTMQIDISKKYTAVLNTSQGIIKIQLNVKETPITANNFVYLAKNNFYNDTIFHRVIKGFMIQGGDPLGDGSGGPGYRFEDEPFTGQYTRGTVAMANAGPNTNGSQFFIMHQDYNLPANYVIFGQVLEGMEVVDKIANVEVTSSRSGEASQPVQPVLVQTVEILEE
ncbi:MAG: peptidylprolyl isomerase [Candidatus Woesebacteria bacterium]|jgi:peptidylprolyl isomerase